MSKTLMMLLGRSDDKLLQVAFDDFEKATHSQATDVKLVGDILHAAHKTIRAIGLDNDVTARELYQALRAHEDMLDETTAFVGLVIDGEVISFHRDDIESDTAERRTFTKRSLEHMRNSLATEVARRYIEQAAQPELLRRSIQQLEK